MKIIVDNSTISKAEKELSESIASMKEQRHQLKLLITVFTDAGKALSGFAKDLYKLASHTKGNSTSTYGQFNSLANNIVLASGRERDDSGIVNSCWQSLTVLFDELVRF
jgi:hypothetical protein